MTKTDLRTHLKKPELFQQHAFWGGQWQAKKETFAVYNPANGDEIAYIADCDPGDVNQAVEAANAAFSGWAAMPAHKRGQILQKWAQLMRENQEDLAVLMTCEQGKPVKESIGEIIYAASFLDWFAEEGRRAYGATIPSSHPDSRIVTVKAPVGIAAAITPWNFPSAMITRKAGAALAAGCPFVVKPAAQTPLSALALAVLAQAAGVPPGVFAVLPSSQSSEIGKAFCNHVDIRKISFTGSTKVGRILMAQSADTLKKLSLELGGNAPFIVFDDADLKTAIEALMTAKFRNAGQACIAANRIYVHQSVFDAFKDKLMAQMKTLKMGSGLEDGVRIGPLIDGDAIQKAQKLLDHAVDNNGEILFGGAIDGAFCEPTLVTGMSDRSDIGCEEIFAPIAALYPFETEGGVIERANDTQYGLAAYVMTSDASRQWRMGEALQFGMIGMNTGSISAAQAPFGGIKQSGFGREGAAEGLDEYLVTKYLAIAV